jgi:PTS system nitrogen regulatory IIA component
VQTLWARGPMEAETLDLPELARYLNRDLRDLEKLASKGRLPGRRVGGRWTVRRSEVHHWLERSVPEFDDEQLSHMESALAKPTVDDLLIVPLLAAQRISLALNGRTAPGVLKDLVDLANADWHVYDPEKVLTAVREREASASTAMADGVAVPHPRRRMPDLLAESLIAFGRAPGGIPFGDPHGGLTDLFFLVLAQDDVTHLRVLARLARLFLRGEFLDQLRRCETPNDVVAAVADAERDAS